MSRPKDELKPLKDALESLETEAPNFEEIIQRRPNHRPVKRKIMWPAIAAGVGLLIAFTLWQWPKGNLMDQEERISEVVPTSEWGDEDLFAGEEVFESISEWESSTDFLMKTEEY